MGYAAEHLTRGAFAVISMGSFIAHVYAHIIPFLGCWKVDELDAQVRVFDAQRRVFGAQARVFHARLRVFRARLRAPPRGKSAATAINGGNKALG